MVVVEWQVLHSPLFCKPGISYWRLSPLLSVATLPLPFPGRAVTNYSLVDRRMPRQCSRCPGNQTQAAIFPSLALYYYMLQHPLLWILFCISCQPKPYVAQYFMGHFLCTRYANQLFVNRLLDLLWSLMQVVFTCSCLKSGIVWRKWYWRIFGPPML